MYFEGSQIDRRMHFMRIFAFFEIPEIFVILAGFQAQICIPGAISCPGMVPDHSGHEFSFKTGILLATDKNNQKYQPCDP